MDFLIQLFTQKGDAEYIGEPVSQWEHASQSAELALAAGADDEVVLAAFLHDVGHLCHDADAPQMAGFGTLRHEQVGAEFLRRHGAPERVARLVEAHVQAKRYLTWRDADYLARLSPASRETLDWQGGPMSTEEAQAFEQDPDFEDILQLRRWDEAAKETGRPLLDWAVLQPIWERCRR